MPVMLITILLHVTHDLDILYLGHIVWVREVVQVEVVRDCQIVMDYQVVEHSDVESIPAQNKVLYIADV
jgi:hypothetical protein